MPRHVAALLGHKEARQHALQLLLLLLLHRGERPLLLPDRKSETDLEAGLPQQAQLSCAECAGFQCKL